MPRGDRIAVAALPIAGRVRPQVPQRHMFSIASMSASVGFFVRLSESTAAMIWPGWQKPHCGTSMSSQPCCTGCNVPPLARPSIVVTFLPRTAETLVTQVCTALPSTGQVRALQTLGPPPCLEPLMPSLPRRTQSSAMPSGASTLTAVSLTVKF